MSTQNKEINHEFNIGDIVYVLNDYAIMPGLVIGIESKPEYKLTIDEIPSIDKTTIIYRLIKLRRNKNKESKLIFEVSLSGYDEYSYHSSKVYANVGDLLSDLEKTTEIP